ncbi:SGNH/GDSL hydrolase family protein [Stenotrophomonas indicatrix]|uniref:SGNH/GDSL hydrolase family protein n=1 Tax=Stenotrophomonas indicatrix TaxID=2045451 RepID=UPI001AA191FD|nr:SGNH/GDSL hydrolase family protein [Stenotrophomonas indicatrix]MBO1748896.1 SGNH/GDSL hydrolase family protein [Stenotrophomonas indicatrix]
MANIPEPVPEFREVYEWTTKDRAKAGPSGIMIVPLQDLMARDGYLKGQIEAQAGTIGALATRADENEAAIEQTNTDVAALDTAYKAADTGLQTQVDDLVAGQSTSAIYANTLTDLQAVTGSFVGQGGFVTNGTGSGQYRWSGSVWDFLRADTLASKADKNSTLYGIASADRGVDDALSQIVVTENMVTQVIHNAVFAPVSNRAVYSASEAAGGLPVNTYRFWIQDVPQLGDLTLSVYSRVQGGASEYPPTANDTLLTTVTINGAELAQTSAAQYVEFRLPQSVTSTGSNLLVWKLSAAGGLNIGIRNDATGITQFRRGWFGNAGGSSQLVTSPNRLAYEAFYRDIEGVLAPQVEALEEQSAVIDRSFIREFSASGAHVANDLNYPVGSGHWAWTFGAQAGAGQDIPAGMSIDTLSESVELSPSVSTIRLRVWSRPTDAATYGVYPASDGTATLLYSATKTVAELGLSAVSGVWQALRFGFPQIVTEAGKTYLFEIWAFTSGAANTAIGITRADDLSYNTQQRGWYRGSSSIGAGSALAWQLGGDVYKVESEATDDGSDNLLDAYDLDISASGLSVNVTGSAYGDGGRAVVNSALTATAAASGTETKDDYSLIYDTDTVWTSISGAWIGRRHISGVSAVRSDNGNPLVLGTDFAYHVNGKVRGLVNVAPYNIDVSYSYKRERYDLLQIDPQTQVVSIKSGTERDFDAVEYVPTPDSGRVVVGYLHVVGSDVTPVNASKFQGCIVRDGTEGDWQQLLYQNRSSLRGFLGKVARGEPVTVASYGDSIVAVQLGTPSFAANTAARDRPENYLINYPSDTVAALPKFDFGDGAGEVHVKISAVWSLVSAIEAVTAQPVTYLNFGLGGTTSSNTTNNGLWPARLQPVLDSGADLLVLHYGMNELGSATTLANIKSIVAQAKLAGMDVVIMSVPRRNGVDGASLTGWNYTNRALWRAAIESGSAYAPQHWIVQNGDLGGMGAATDSLGAAALFNHPGPAEFKRYGQVLVQSVLG